MMNEINGRDTSFDLIKISYIYIYIYIYQQIDTTRLEDKLTPGAQLYMKLKPTKKFKRSGKAVNGNQRLQCFFLKSELSREIQA